MNFNKHSKLEGKHAFLGASKYHWINYSDDKLVESYSRHQASKKGTDLHELAKKCIDLGVKLPRNNSSLSLYVNDAIGYKMKTEQTLYYSENCFGTADAISFRKNLLRIHDYKSGETRSSMKQLLVYAALFCLEYDVKPVDIIIELRLYQFDDVLVEVPAAEEVVNVMDTIIRFDMIIEQIKLGGGFYE